MDLVREVTRFGGKLKCLYLPAHEWDAIEDVEPGVLEYGMFWIGNCEIRRSP
jgi:hypothetical protein